MRNPSRSGRAGAAPPGSAHGSSTTSAEPVPTPTLTPGSASRRRIASAIGPRAGERTAVPIVPSSRSPSRTGSPGGRAGEPQPAQVAVRLALVMQPGGHWLELC